MKNTPACHDLKKKAALEGTASAYQDPEINTGNNRVCKDPVVLLQYILPANR